MLRILLLAAGLVVAMCGAACAAEDDDRPIWQQAWETFSLTGWVETVNSVRTTRDHSTPVSFLRGRLEASANVGNLYAFVSGEGEGNREVYQLNGARLREAWLEYDTDSWDIRVGRQIIVWGRADGLRITDNISPPDYTDFVLRGMEDTHKPVTALRFRTLGDLFTTEFIWKPFFEPMDLPDGDGSWAINLGLDKLPSGLKVNIQDDEKHQSSLGDSELAFKVSHSGSGFDVSFSFIYGWDNLPSYAIDMTPRYEDGVPIIDVEPRHYRVCIYGADVAVPWGDFVFRGEAALIAGRRMYRDDMSLKNGNLLKYLFGVDWTPGDGWSLTAQFTDDWILGYTSNLSNDEHKPLVTASLSKKLLRETLTLKEQVFTYLHDGQSMYRISAEYQICDGLTASIGYDHFVVDEDSYYKNFGNNDQVWTKIRYSF